MFFQLIEKKRDRWFEGISETHPVKVLMRHIATVDALRDAQVGAVKTYLFLKLECGARPLWELFSSGIFNTSDPEQSSRFRESREYLKSHPGALALWEYAGLTSSDGKEVASALKKALEESPWEIDDAAVWRNLFYGVGYTDYLFSLPMGAGKTFLMAAFIYIDLYFARQNPQDKRFAHNFMVLAPSGLKSSIVPSLRKIQDFDPSWVIPEPAASELKKLVCFDVLDEQKSAKKSNRVRNPNAQKVNQFLATNMTGGMGYVAVTNAEKVILDRFFDGGELGLDPTEEERVKLANELRSLIGKLPNLSIFIDEVHHAADSEIRLRQVVTQWASSTENTFVQSIGFSGTPYLEKAETILITDKLKLKSNELSNIVFHYPLIKGLGNFLKIPRVQVSSSTSSEAIITEGVKDFLENYGKVVYRGDLCAKLAIYCGQIETLEERVAPLVSKLLADAGYDPTVVMLKFHRGNKTYPQPEGADSAFAVLDTSVSKVRVILLAQIGKEGWDCRSLASVILPHQGVCPNNMVLQTSCRCLRQTERGKQEPALIWLNRFNADKLNRQLEQLQDSSLEEFGSAKPKERPVVKRYNRTSVQQVPSIDYYQLHVSYETYSEEHVPVAERLLADGIVVEAQKSVITKQDFEGRLQGIEDRLDASEEETLSFFGWLNRIAKESMGNLSIETILQQQDPLRRIYSCISHSAEEGTRLKSEIDQDAVRANVRRAFYAKRSFKPKASWELCRAELVDCSRWKEEFSPESLENIIPDAKSVEEIRRWDENRQKPVIDESLDAMIRQSQEAGVISAEQAEAMRASMLLQAAKNMTDPHPDRSQTYHYAPYRFDSALEKDWFRIALAVLNDFPHLKVYFNGDDAITGFRIRCFKQENDRWKNLGEYVPDFVVIKQKTNGSVEKILIVETKGSFLKERFNDRRTFMEHFFPAENNKQFSSNRFGFLYLEDSEDEVQRQRKTLESVKSFFGED